MLKKCISFFTGLLLLLSQTSSFAYTEGNLTYDDCWDGANLFAAVEAIGGSPQVVVDAAWEYYWQKCIDQVHNQEY